MRRLKKTAFITGKQAPRSSLLLHRCPRRSSVRLDGSPATGTAACLVTSRRSLGIGTPSPRSRRASPSPPTPSTPSGLALSGPQPDTRHRQATLLTPTAEHRVRIEHGLTEGMAFAYLHRRRGGADGRMLEGLREAENALAGFGSSPRLAAGRLAALKRHLAALGQ